MDQHAGCHVFVLKPTYPQSGQYTKPQVTRRRHRKSRAGCSTCRQKRVKCDEKHPCCTYCVRRKIECSYESSPPSDRRSSGQSSPGELDTAFEDETSDALVRHESPTRPFEAASTEVLLYNHYEIMTRSGLLVGTEPGRYHRRVLSLAQDHPYLLHAQLAIAALHLTASGVKLYEKAQLYNLSQALHEFQKAISKPIARQDSDALIMTTMMINMIYFHTNEDSEQGSWLWSKSPSRLTWFSVQQGMGAILSHTRPHHCESGLLSHFYVEPKPILSGRRVPDAFWELCDVTDEIGPRGVHPNPYHDVLHCINLLLPLQPGVKSLIKYMHFCGRIYPTFIALVGQNDHRALLILSYWFALLTSVGDLWWCKLRARRDCLAICAFLDAAGSDTVRTLLEFPAEACGYVMRETFSDEEICDQEVVVPRHWYEAVSGMANLEWMT